MVCSKGDYDKAIADFNEAVRFAPKDVQCHRVLAWLHAVCPNEKYRDGKRAVEFATKACELAGWKTVDELDTLAAASAEAGDFANAVIWQEKAIDLAPEKDKGPRRARLDLYQSGKPYREEPTNGIDFRSWENSSGNSDHRRLAGQKHPGKKLGRQEVRKHSENLGVEDSIVNTADHQLKWQITAGRAAP